MKNDIASTLVRLRSDALHVLYEAAVAAKLTRPFGRAAYLHNRRLNDTTFNRGGTMDNFLETEAVQAMRRINIKTAIRWERHLRNGGHPKSLTRKGVTK